MDQMVTYMYMQHRSKKETPYVIIARVQITTVSYLIIIERMNRHLLSSSVIHV